LLWTKLAHRYQVFYVDEVCAEYRIHAGSYSFNLDWEKIASAKQLEHLRRVSDWVTSDDGRARQSIRVAWQQLGDRIIYRLYRALRDRDFSQARREMAALRRMRHKASLVAAPLRWYRTRLEARQKPAVEEQLSDR
jgi:hypothetical protein